MNLNTQKELFSLAYVRAVAAVAGYKADVPRVDDDSIDMTVSATGLRGTVRSPKLDVQIKCGVLEVGDTAIPYPLKIKNYDDLRHADVQVPRILVVVAVPGDDPETWLEQSEQEMVVRRCAWWLSLRDRPEVENKASVTVHVPRENIFSVDALQGIMSRLGNGETP